MPAKRRGLSSNGLDGLDVVIPDRTTTAARSPEASRDTRPGASSPAQTTPSGPGPAGTPGHDPDSPDKPEPDKPEPDKPEPDKPEPDKPSTDKPSTDKAPTGKASADQASAAQTPAARTKPIKFSSYLDPEIADRLRNVLFFLGGDWTTGALLGQALTRELDRLADEYNDGDPFPPRSSTRLRPGSRIRRD